MLPTVRLDPELEARFAQLSFKMGRSKTYCIKEALEDYIDRSEYENELLVDAAEYRAGRLNTYSLDETKTSSMASIRSDELERAFDAGEDITKYMDMSTLERPNQSPAFRRISMDVPEEVCAASTVPLAAWGSTGRRSSRFGLLSASTRKKSASVRGSRRGDSRS